MKRESTSTDWKRKIQGLYKGLEFEYYVASKFWGLGYEATKLPIDFGFDLMIWNQKERSLQECESESMEIPYVIQVKSCRINKSYIKTENLRHGQCLRYDAVFYFHKEEIEMIINDPAAFVVFVFAKDTSPTEIVDVCWLNSKQISKLWQKDTSLYSCKLPEGDFFAYDADKQKYKIMLSTVDEINRKEELETLLIKAAGLKDKIENDLEIKEVSNLAQSFYTSLTKDGAPHWSINTTKRGQIGVYYHLQNKNRKLLVFLPPKNNRSKKLGEQRDLSKLDSNVDLFVFESEF